MTLTHAAFDSAILKVQRANHHIDELNAIVARFGATPFYEIIVDKDTGGGSQIAINPIQTVPNSLPLIIGDVVHNLHSALDHLATSCIRKGGGKERDALFPFHKERKNLVSDTAKLDPIKSAIPGAKRLIIDEIQPCDDGNGSDLYALHTLDVTDKHKQLIVLATVTLAGHLIVRNDAGDVILGTRTLKFDPNNKTVVPIGPLPENITIEHDYKATLDILFAEPAALRNESVSPTLMRLSERTTEIIKLFSALV